MVMILGLGYSNVEGEWYIAYHGTGGLRVVKNNIFLT